MHTQPVLFTGTYFKAFTDPVSIAETVAASDALLFVGMHFNEMSWVRLHCVTSC